MFAFILRRLLQAVVVMVAVAFIAFLLFQYVGDPVTFLLYDEFLDDFKIVANVKQKWLKDLPLKATISSMDIATQAGLDWDTVGAALKRDGRLHLETY